MTAPPQRAERLLNLLALLVESRGGATLEEIAAESSLGYTSTGESLRRAFERDKSALRAIGIEITQSLDGEKARYRVAPEDFYLRDLRLDADERAALRVAVSAVALGDAAALDALIKIGEEGIDGASPILQIPLGENLGPIFSALRRREAIEFSYLGRERRVSPWGISCKFGHWYVVGRDEYANGDESDDTEQGIRTFRSDRIQDLSLTSESSLTDPPEGFRAEDHIASQPWQFGRDEPLLVTVRVVSEHADALMQRLGAEISLSPGPDNHVDLGVWVSNIAGIQSVVLGMLEHAEIISPVEVRESMISWLTALAGPAQ